MLQFESSHVGIDEVADLGSQLVRVVACFGGVAQGEEPASLNVGPSQHASPEASPASSMLHFGRCCHCLPFYKCSGIAKFVLVRARIDSSGLNSDGRDFGL